MWGVRLSQKRRGTEDELEFKDGYVQRKDSKKAKFSTTVQVIERRRVSDATTASYGTEPAPNSPTIVAANVSEVIQRPETPGSLKKTRFSDDVAILGEDNRTSSGV
ncbi:Protein F37B12.1 [Aphelenchoides avenae]|nr:Protein F37B12.1 [Aphelenchus avenae]